MSEASAIGLPAEKGKPSVGCLAASLLSFKYKRPRERKKAEALNLQNSAEWEAYTGGASAVHATYPPARNRRTAIPKWSKNSGPSRLGPRGLHNRNASGRGRPAQGDPPG